MTAKLLLIGHPEEELRIEKGIVTFRIVAGPATDTTPRACRSSRRSLTWCSVPSGSTTGAAPTAMISPI